jgi:hypothetical protein
MSAFWGDYDGDGDLDLAVANTLEADVLYRNEGAGVFSARPVSLGPSGAVNGGGWVDLNRDGRLDFLSTSIYRSALLVNTGSEASPLAYVPSALDSYDDARDLIAADYDLDGDADVVLVRRFDQGSRLFRNTGGYLALVTGGGIANDNDDTATACWSDMDGDRYPELYVANVSFYRDRLYRNVGGTLVEVENAPIGEANGSQGCAWGDYDGDGDLDLYVTKEKSTAQAPLVNRLFLNDDGVLVPAQAGALTSDGRSMGVSLVDDDGDGDLDLYVANGGPRTDLPPERNRLFRNTTNGAAHWLALDLRGTRSDRFGLGARVTAYATIAGVPRVLVREVQARPWRLAQDGFRLHFGLGDAAVVDSLVVEWPVAGRQVLTGVAADTLLTIEEPFVVAAEAPAPAARPSLRAYPNPSADLVTLVVQGVEDGPVRVEVFDALGRRVGAAEGVSVGGAARLAWDGALAPAGRYVLRVAGRPEVDPDTVVIAR